MENSNDIDNIIKQLNEQPENKRTLFIDMIKTMIDNETDIPKPIEKRPRGRPRLETRTIINGKYDSKPLDKDYHKKYYLEKIQGTKIMCPGCSREVPKTNLSRHMRTNNCVKE